ncbi:hypothetical protein AgCh_030733 [Apium graveolens]
MKGMLAGVVTENQSAFIPGRLITSNIMISFEIMHYLERKRRGKEGCMALKLDMSKANEEEVSQVLNLLNSFEVASGQKINLSKSSVLFSSNIIQSNKENICQLLQMDDAVDRKLTKDIERSLTKYWCNSNPKKVKAIHWLGWEQLCRHKSTGGEKTHSWVKPHATIKVTVDAPIFSRHNAFGIGMVARDSKGALIISRSASFKEHVRAEYVEAVAIREALSWIKERNCPEVIVESDCLVVTQAINSKAKMISLFGRVIQECRGMLSESHNLSVIYQTVNHTI